MLCYSYELVFCSELPRPSRKQLLTDIKGVSAIFWWCHENLDKELVAAAGTKCANFYYCLTLELAIVSLCTGIEILLAVTYFVIPMFIYVLFIKHKYLKIS